MGMLKSKKSRERKPRKRYVRLYLSVNVVCHRVDVAQPHGGRASARIRGECWLGGGGGGGDCRESWCRRRREELSEREGESEMGASRYYW